MKPRTWIKCSVIILGVIIIPLLYSYFYLGAFWDPYNRLETVPVAVVNEDEGAEINGETRNLGSEAMKKIIDDGTLKFTETSAKDAESGVNGTKYYAVIRFPKDFSAKIATSTETNKEVAAITYSANMKHNYICSQIMKNAVLTIEEQTRDSVSKEITSTLVDKLNQVPDSLSTLDDGLTKLSNGANTLSDGTTKYVDAQGTLTDALSQLKSGTSALYNGSATLHNGIVTLDSGVNKVASGTKELSEGTKQLPALVSGVSRLNDGAKLLVAQTKTSGNPSEPTLYDGITQLSAGLSQLNAQFKTSGDADNLTLWDATYRLSAGLSQLNAQFTTSGDINNPSLYDGTKQVAQGVDTLYAQMFETSGKEENPSVYDNINTLNAGTSQYVETFDSSLYYVINNDTDRTATVDSLNTNLNNALNEYNATADTAKKATIMNTEIVPLKNLLGIYSMVGSRTFSSPAEFKAYITTVENATNNKTSVANGETLSAGTAQLAAAVADGSPLKTQVGNLKSGANAVFEQFSSGTFKTGVKAASDGASELYKQVDKNGKLNASVNALTAGATTLKNSYTGTYTDGVNEVAGGMNTLLSKATNLGKLTDGVDKLNAGAYSLSGGTEKLVNGSASLESNLATADSAVSAISNGNSQLASAAQSINSGASQLEDGLNTAKSGVEDSISDTNEQLKSTDGLADYAEKSVEVKEEDVNHLPNYGSAFAPYFMSLSLYVGALLIFFGIYLDADDRIKVLSRHSDNKVVRVMGFAGIGAAQAIALALICQFVLGLSIDNIPAFYGSLILISLVFISIVEFLVVNLKDIGKFLSIAFLVLNLTSNGGTFPMETTPDMFQAMYKFMPMTYSVNLLKEITVNFDGNTARYDALVLVGIFVIFTGLTLLFSITRKAKVKVEKMIQSQS